MNVGEKRYLCLATNAVVKPLTGGLDPTTASRAASKRLIQCVPMLCLLLRVLLAAAYARLQFESAVEDHTRYWNSQYSTCVCPSTFEAPSDKLRKRRLLDFRRPQYQRRVEIYRDDYLRDRKKRFYTLKYGGWYVFNETTAILPMTYCTTPLCI